jgi:ketosteroid isomerase-like protein
VSALAGVAVDDPAVVAEVTAAFDAYEAALVAGDNETVCALFWSDPRTVRFGVADAQDGHAAIAAWRSTQGPLPGRRLHGSAVHTFGSDLAVVTTRFSYPGGAAEGRQTQTWVRFPEGWRVVSAHVSEIGASDG